MPGVALDQLQFLRRERAEAVIGLPGCELRPLSRADQPHWGSMVSDTQEDTLGCHGLFWFVEDEGAAWKQKTLKIMGRLLRNPHASPSPQGPLLTFLLSHILILAQASAAGSPELCRLSLRKQRREICF